MKAILLAVAVSVCAGGCSNPSGARVGLFSAEAPVLAILHDDLFTGTATGYHDRTGTIEMVSSIDPAVKCVGQFRYTGSNIGTANIQCNDGVVADIAFNAISSLSGYGFGTSPRGAVSFTYGLTPEEAEPRLQLPKGRKLVKKPSGVRLETT